MSALSTVIGRGTNGARPAAGNTGRLYYDTTNSQLQRDNGSSWDAVQATTLSDPTTTRGDVITRGAAALGRLAVGGAGRRLSSDGTDVVWRTGPALLLDYALASDITNQALTTGTAFDMFANQNFTVSYATSLIEVAVRGMCFCNDAVSNQYVVRANIDSGGTPVLKYVGGANNTNVTANNRQNPISGGSVYVSGLTAAVHTIKIQFLALTNNDHLYCRASTNGPTTGGEFLSVQVIEHP